MRTVKVRTLTNYQQLVVTDLHAFVADEPKGGGGDALGPSPYDLLLASLGTWTAITLLMYVRRKGWPVQGIDIDLSHERIEAQDGKERQDIFRVNIHVKGDLNEEQRERLKYIASRCPVHRTLTSTPQIIEELEVERPPRD